MMWYFSHTFPYFTDEIFPQHKNVVTNNTSERPGFVINQSGQSLNSRHAIWPPFKDDIFIGNNNINLSDTIHRMGWRRTHSCDVQFKVTIRSVLLVIRRDNVEIKLNNIAI